jgi:2'-5' RNA ligase
MSDKRIQLTLFADPNQAESIESIRKKFNPIQFELIQCHVTLCREDELQNLENVLKNFIKTIHQPVVINFGQVIRFAEGKGVLLPAVGENMGFHELRKSILPPSILINKADPHITLMHPRNSTCTDNIFEQIKMIKLPGKLQFKKGSLIEQVIGKKWNILKEFELL